MAETNTERQIESARQLVDRFHEVAKVVIGCEDILVQALLALMTREHLLWVGKPGRAKSFTARIIMQMLTGARLFRTQINQDTLPASIFGNAIPNEYLETGREIFNLDGGIAHADLVLLEEFFDGNRDLVRSVLTVLNERRFEAKDMVTDCPLHTAILTTNWKAMDAASEAVRDRLVFKATFPDIEGLTGRLQVYKAYLSYAGNTPMVSPFPFDEIQAVAALVESPDGIEIPMHVQLVHALLVRRFQELREQKAVAEFKKQLGNGGGTDNGQGSTTATVVNVNVEDLKVAEVSPRTENKLHDLSRAAALIHGRTTVEYDDLAMLRYGLTMIGSGDGEDALFAQALKDTLPRSSQRGTLKRLGRIADQLIVLTENPPENVAELVVDLGAKSETYTRLSLLEFFDSLRNDGGPVPTIAASLKQDVQTLGERGKLKLK